MLFAGPTVVHVKSIVIGPLKAADGPYMDHVLCYLFVYACIFCKHSVVSLELWFTLLVHYILSIFLVLPTKHVTSILSSSR